MDAELQFKCEECGKNFDADPDIMLELNVSMEGDEISESEIADVRETLNELRAKGQVKITDEQVEAYLRGETISPGAICICKSCQDKLAELSDD